MLCLSCCLFIPDLFIPPPRLSIPLFPSVSSMCVPGSSTLFMSGAPVLRFSTPLFFSGCLLMPRLSASLLGLSALLSLFAFGVYVFRSSALSASGTLVPKSSTCLSPFDYLPMPGLSTLSLSDCLLISRSSPLFPN